MADVSVETAVFCSQNLIFRFLQSRQKVQIWLYEQTDLRIEGRIIVSLSATSDNVLHRLLQTRTLARSRATRLT